MDLESDKGLHEFEKIMASTLAGFNFHYKKRSFKQHRYRIDLGQGNAISLETYKEWVGVNMKISQPEIFEGTLGMMGAFPGGEKFARDGITIMTDTDSFGNEWQVLDSEPMLFHKVAGVQHPTKCEMPSDVSKTTKRRLGETLTTTEDAAIACAHAGERLDECVYDGESVFSIRFLLLSWKS